MMHQGFGSKEARRAVKQKYRLRQTTSHSSLLDARHGDISRKLNQVFLLVDSFNYNFIDEERTDIYVYRNRVTIKNFIAQYLHKKLLHYLQRNL